MSSENFGAIVMRHDVDNQIPLRVGDGVITYELGESWPYRHLPQHSGHTMDLLAYQDTVLQHANADDDWRVQEQLHCDCRARRVVAQVLVHKRSARLWVTAKPERVPAAFRANGAASIEGWAMHGSEEEAPHIGGVSSCKGCDKRWLVVSFADHAELVRIRSATHGATVAP